jgi:hypothetical protein
MAGSGPAVMTAQRTDVQDDVQNENLGGGFYKDGYKADDWFYDYYESSVVGTDPQVSERPATRNAQAVRVAEQDRLADASQSKNSPFYTRRRHAQEAVFGRYYDETSFYQQQDPAYAVPTTVAQSNTNRPAARDEEMLGGIVGDVKQVRNWTRGGQNTVALVKTSKGSVIADLGPTQPLLGLALMKGDDIKVSGHRENIGPYSVLMAHQVRSGANRVSQNRDAAWSGRDYRQVNGRIDQFRDIRVRETGAVHRAASVRTDDGRLVLVDFGPSSAGKIPATAAPGDRVTASGSIAQVGNYPVLFADRVSIKDGSLVQIARPASEYAEPSERPFEASQQERSR